MAAIHLIWAAWSGEFDSRLDPELAIDILYGAIYRLLVTHLPLDQQFVDHLPQWALNVLKPNALVNS